MAKAKKKKPKYNQTSAIVSSLKRTFSRSPIVAEVLKQHRQEHPQYNKDGSLAKKPAVRYPCVECNNIHMGKNIQVDHIEPVIPLNIPAKHACMDVVISRLFCDKSNLQILCKDCHKTKSKEENIIRNAWKSEDKEKHMVYKTTNTENGKFYIGIHSTKDYDDGYLGSGVALKDAINKYGKDKFYRKILFVFETRKEALEKEAELVNESFIKSDDTYNLVLGGQGCINIRKGFTPWNKGKTSVYSQDTLKKMSDSNIGKQTGEKNSNFGGKSFTTEIRAKIGNREYPTGKDHVKSKRIYCVELNKHFDSITSAKKELNTKSNILRAIKENKTACGYHWKYATNPTSDI